MRYSNLAFVITTLLASPALSSEHVQCSFFCNSPSHDSKENNESQVFSTCIYQMAFVWFVPTLGWRVACMIDNTSFFSLHVTQLYCPSCKRIFQAAVVPRLWRSAWRRSPWILRGLCWPGSHCGHTMRSSFGKVIELWVVESSWKIPPLVRWGPSP